MNALVVVILCRVGAPRVALVKCLPPPTPAAWWPVSATPFRMLQSGLQVLSWDTSPLAGGGCPKLVCPGQALARSGRKREAARRNVWGPKVFSLYSGSLTIGYSIISGSPEAPFPGASRVPCAAQGAGLLCALASRGSSSVWGRSWWWEGTLTGPASPGRCSTPCSAPSTGQVLSPGLPFGHLPRLPH